MLARGLTARTESVARTDTLHIMPLAPVLVIIVAILVGAALGWWPLAQWTRRSLRTDEGLRMQQRTVRLWSASCTAVAFGALAWRFGSDWVLPALLVFAAASVVLSIVDLAEKRLPNAVIVPALIAVGVLLVVAAAATGEWMSLLWAFGGGVTMFAVYFLLALISPSAMGMGDVKLAALVGLVLGWFGLATWLIGLLGAFVVGGIIAIIALALRRVTLRGSIPFGPSMLVGALAAVLWLGPVAF
ncbi:prepilin peptidase [Agromyces tardus]|uniref:Prepilin peptidase n=2 Tax=Agromyces tardus TaxID=2583849 RepID=A0A3M8AIK7_9MICO|nr:prepilin peptidase [Agromyces tardus]